MLQCIYRNLYISLAASAFAGAAWGQSAANLAEPADGSRSVAACESLSGGPGSQTGFEEALFEFLASARHQNGAGHLTRLASLDAAARHEACAVRERLNAATAGKGATSLVDHVRVAERQHLLGAFGTSTAVIDAQDDPAAAHTALVHDAMNRENMLRSGFDHAGIAIVDAGSNRIVVQLFAKVDGTFVQPLPQTVSSKTDMRAVLSSADMHPVGWSIEAVSGEIIARGRGNRISGHREAPMEGYLNLDVAVGPEVYTLRGPFVQVESN